MAAPMPSVRTPAVEDAPRRSLGVPVRLAGAVILVLLALPLYLRYFAWVLGQCGVGFWAPRVP